MSPIANNSARTATVTNGALPVRVVFIASLLLSFIAVMNSRVPNRDGMLYINVACDILGHGISRATQDFDWPPFSILIADLGYVTRLDLESVARIPDAQPFA